MHTCCHKDPVGGCRRGCSLPQQLSRELGGQHALAAGAVLRQLAVQRVCIQRWWQLLATGQLRLVEAVVVLVQADIGDRGHGLLAGLAALAVDALCSRTRSVAVGCSGGLAGCFSLEVSVQGPPDGEAQALSSPRAGVFAPLAGLGWVKNSKRPASPAALPSGRQGAAARRWPWGCPAHPTAWRHFD
jgi:hypothetical protein